LGRGISSVFAARKPSPEELTKLALSNTPASAKVWTDAYRRYREELPDEARAALCKPDTPERAEAMSAFTRRHVCTVQPIPEELVASFAWIEKDDTVF
jgi:L-proline amide hydrolase